MLFVHGIKGIQVIKVNFDSTGYRGEMLEVFTMITNSPSKPIVNLFLTGNVIK